MAVPERNNENDLEEEVEEETDEEYRERLIKVRVGVVNSLVCHWSVLLIRGWGTGGVVTSLCVIGMCGGGALGLYGYA